MPHWNSDEEIRAVLRSLPVGHEFSEGGITYRVVEDALWPGGRGYQSSASGTTYSEDAWSAGDTKIIGVEPDKGPIKIWARGFRYGVRCRSDINDHSYGIFAAFVARNDAMTFRREITAEEGVAFEVVELETGLVVEG